VTNPVDPRAKERWAELGKWVADRRAKKGFDRVAFARIAGVSVMTLQTLEAGGRNVYGEWVLPNPRHSVVLKVAYALGVPYDVFAVLCVQASAGVALDFEQRVDLVFVQPPSPMEVVRSLSPERRIAYKSERLTPKQQEIVESMIDELLEE